MILKEFKNNKDVASYVAKRVRDQECMEQADDRAQGLLVVSEIILRNLHISILGLQSNVNELIFF